MKKKFIVTLATGLLIFCMVGMAQATGIITANESSTTNGLDDTTATAQYVGTLDSGDVVKINGWIDANNADDVDIYSFAITEPMSLFFDIDYANDINNPYDDDTGVDTLLAVFNSNNMLLSYNDDSDVFDWAANDPGSAPNGDLDSLIGALDLSEGIYYVAVSSCMNNPVAWDTLWSEEWEANLPSLSNSGYLLDGMDVGSTFSLEGVAETTGSYQLIISEDFDGAATVPIPATILLFGSAMVGLAGLKIGRKKK